MLLPTDDTALRRQLDRWLERHRLRPVRVGEFEDYALLSAFGQSGVGVFPVPVILEGQFRRVYGVERLGRVDGVRARYYAISVERKLKHPAMVAISERARRRFMEEISTGRGAADARQGSGAMKEGVVSVAKHPAGHPPLHG